LLSGLSTLAKTAKRLQDSASHVTDANGTDTNDITEEIILKVFKTVNRGVRFLDGLEDDIRTRQQAAVNQGGPKPSTPQVSLTTSRQSHKRMSTAYISNGCQLLYMSKPTSAHIKRQFSSHHLSASIPATQRQKLVSERLIISFDKFLSCLGSFIGRLEVQSQSSADLLVAVRQCATAGLELLAVVEVVCAHDNQSIKSLDTTRTLMDDQINEFVSTARNINKSSGLEDVAMTPQNGALLMSAINCVRAAGNCVTTARLIIERIGDFEFEPQSEGLGIDMVSMDVVTETNTTPAEPGTTIPEPARAPPSTPPMIQSYETPLAKVPSDSPPAENNIARLSFRPVAEDDTTGSATILICNRISRSHLPPIPKMASPFLTQDDHNPSQQSFNHNEGFLASFLTWSSSETSSACLSSMHESSTICQATTTTTSDMRTPRDQSSFSDLSTLGDNAYDSESNMLEKTYAHELLHNKEGHITGGTLPALVEILTKHDSIPDSIFVSAFYLTFRLFVTPVELAETLVDRFDYVAESPQVAEPVRLRVCNVFKCWLESHWRDFSDGKALSVIKRFAHEKLSRILPEEGRRLLELTQKVSSIKGSLVPRLVSSIGKVSKSNTQYDPADTLFPPSNMTKSQVAALKNWKMGGSNPTILEFDPLELARQFTIQEIDIFCSIMPEELLGSEWTRNSGINAVNVRAMSTLSTNLSNLVTDTVLQYEDIKKRGAIIKHWIKVAHKCLELKNYSSLMAITCSLNSSTIERLKRTWGMVSSKHKNMLKDLQTIVEPYKNFTILRRRLQHHGPPCLPYLGMYLTDLTFVDAGNPDTKQLPGTDDHEDISVINFDKHIRTANIISELQRFQVPYRLKNIPDLQEWIQAEIVRVRSSGHENVILQQHYRKSLLLEPRENAKLKVPIVRIADPTAFFGRTRNGSAVPRVSTP
jgi:hypothetical protein